MDFFYSLNNSLYTSPKHTVYASNWQNISLYLCSSLCKNWCHLPCLAVLGLCYTNIFWISLRLQQGTLPLVIIYACESWGQKNHKATQISTFSSNTEPTRDGFPHHVSSCHIWILLGYFTRSIPEPSFICCCCFQGTISPRVIGPCACFMHDLCVLRSLEFHHLDLGHHSRPD